MRYIYTSIAAIVTVIFASITWADPPSVSTRQERAVASPNEEVVFELLEGSAGVLRYQVRSNDRIVIEPSKLGIVVDGENIVDGAKVSEVERYEKKEQFATRGNRSSAASQCRGGKFSFADEQGNIRCILDVRAFDDGVAFRHVVPGEGSRTPDAGSEFKLPAGTAVWTHDLGGHYEGVPEVTSVEELPEDEWIAPPMTFKLPRDGGYGAITEAALINYAGMALQSTGDHTFGERLGHSQPVGTPFRIRFSKEDAERLSNAAPITGEIVTPWRVIMIGKSLNTLVNCQILESLSPPADQELFPKGMHTAWIKPGRSVWKFLDGGESSLEGMIEFSRAAKELGFEYNLIEGFWQRWSKDELKQLVDVSRDDNVGIWLWKDSRDLRTDEERKAFFGMCRDVGVVGVKIDFLDHESKETIDLYQILLKQAAEHRLMVNFHGANKPTGEPRTWPNELTREGVRGMEARRIDSRSQHDATLPFTRYLAGHGDYTPVVFGERRGDTTAAHQIATAAIFTSPLLVYGGHPASLLKHPAADMIKSIPSEYDETIVLPDSEIGRVAAFARRKGDVWFLAVLAGPEEQKLQLSLSFLDSGMYQAMLVRDTAEDPTEVAIERTQVSSRDLLRVALDSGGGFIARFSRDPRLSSVNAANP
jgi:alpha-glucosidase